MTNILRAQAVFEHRSGLPKDRISNNFWFHVGAGLVSDAAAVVAGRVMNFYTTDVFASTRSLGQLMAPAIADTTHYVKVYSYEMETGERLAYEGAPPEHTLAFNISDVNLGPSDSAAAMPSEVSLCLSYKSTTGAVPGGGNFNTPIAQRRGRIYAGPFTISQSAADGQGVARPIADLRNGLLTLGATLGDDSQDHRWVVYSRPYAGRAEVTAAQRAAAGGPARALPALPARTGQAYFIDQLSIDDAWDTQRRRGEAPTARTTAPVS